MSPSLMSLILGGADFIVADFVVADFGWRSGLPLR